MALPGLLLLSASAHSRGPAGLLQPEGAALVDLWKQANSAVPSSAGRVVAGQQNATRDSGVVANATTQQLGVLPTQRKNLTKLSEQEGEGELGDRWRMAGIALGWGLLSAVSLVLGAGLAMFVELDRKTLSMMMAFGGGALIEALSIELFGHLKHEQLDEGIPNVLWIGLVAALVGGLAYYAIDRLLNSQGAFVRSAAHVNAALQELQRLEEMVEETCEDALHLPHLREHQHLHPHEQHTGTPAAEEPEGDKTTSKPSRRTIQGHGRYANSSIESLSRGATVQSLGWVQKTHHVPKHVPSEVQKATSLDQRVSITMDPPKEEEEAEEEEEKAASKEEEPEALPPGVAESPRPRDSASGTSATPGSRRKSSTSKGERRTSIIETHHSIEIEHSKSAAMSIWLGILLDGIAESLVLGLMANEATEAREPGLMYAFVISVFVANFPEALSSAGTMKRVGMAPLTIMMMWGLIFVLTGVGAAAGSLLFPPGDDENDTPKHVQAALEGVCGGAMLTAISNTVFPEAFEGGGAAVGIASLAGFVTALAVGGITA